MSENYPPGSDLFSSPWAGKKVSRSVSFTVEGNVEIETYDNVSEDSIRDSIADLIRSECRKSGLYASNIEIFE